MYNVQREHMWYQILLFHNNYFVFFINVPFNLETPELFHFYCFCLHSSFTSWCIPHTHSPFSEIIFDTLLIIWISYQFLELMHNRRHCEDKKLTSEKVKFWRLSKRKKLNCFLKIDRFKEKQTSSLALK